MKGALLALLALGCAAVPPPPPTLVLEAERARVVVPAGAPFPPGHDGEFTRDGVTVRTPDLTGEAGGADFSIVAEGNVRILRFDGKRTFEEGPYRLVVFRNGQILTR